MVTKKELLQELALQEKKANERLKAVQKKRLAIAKKEREVKEIKKLKQKIALARSKGKTPLLTTAEKQQLKTTAKKAVKKTGFILDVIAYGYKKAKKKNR